MASSYPGGIDSLTNPATSDSMAVVSHASQHANANDAIEAIQAELGTDPSGASASVAARFDTKVTKAASSTDNALVRFDGPGGDTVQNSGITVDDSGNVSSDLTISKASALLKVTGTGGTHPVVRITGDAGTNRSVFFYTGANDRWCFRADNAAESGSDAGSNFVILNTLDSGAGGGTPFKITRATGKVTLGLVGASAGLELGASGPRDMVGTGSPEGVVTAPVASTWRDTAATTGAIRWVKATGTGNTGWVVEYGDTGNRNMNAATWLNGWASYGGSGQSLRRIGNVVNMRLELTKASATADDVYTLPSGFRPAISVVHQVWATGAGDDYCTSYVTSSGAVAIGRSLSSSNVIYGYVQYITADPWPSSLPGTA